MANVVIDIAAEFTGNKAFKQAETSTEKLTKNVKKLAGSLGLAFGTAQIIAFGKASIKAALEAQAQQERLASLLRVTVGATEAEIDALNKQAEALQRLGVVNKENITQTQSQLATFNLQISTIEQLTPAILDYVTAEKGAAASADQFKQMTNGLAQALNGNFASLTKVGFVLDEQTKKTIKSGTETERAAALVKVLDSTYKDFNKNLANTPTGKMVNFANAAEDAKQIIGGGLIDALVILGGNTSAKDLADDMQRGATNAAAFLATVAKIITLLNTPLDLTSKGLAWFVVKTDPFVDLIVEGDPSIFLKKKPKPFTTAMTISGQVQIKQQTKITKEVQKQSAAQAKILKDKKLQNAIDKANLALLKGEEIFDMDKIQLAAALTNQAQLLGKATDATQRLQIANDVARLNVKQSILALEDAIASKDEAAIIAATKKLNEDLKILNALSGQNIKLADIKSILDSLKPKDLINQSNLDAALRKIQEMIALLAQAGLAANAPIPTSGSLGSGIPVGDYIAPIPMEVGTNASIEALIEASEAIQERANAFSMLLDLQTEADTIALANSSLATQTMTQIMNVADVARSSLLQGLAGGAGVAGAVSGSRYAAQAANAYNITVNAGVGDPEAIARALEDYIRQSYQRGTSATGLLAV
jgi:hypothetical protein